MKLTNFTMLWFFLAVALLVPVFLWFGEDTAVAGAEEFYARAMEEAVDDAVYAIVETDRASELVLNRDYMLECFFKTLYMNLGCTADTVKQEAVKAYIPIALVVDRDGFYIHYTSVVKGSPDESVMQKNWTDKLKFTYLDDDGSGRIFNLTLSEDVRVYDPHTNTVYEGTYKDLAKMSLFNRNRPEEGCYRSRLLCGGDFDTLRRTAIINCMTREMEYYINEHNRIAEQFGITYQFALPYISEDDWARTIDDISFVALWQGYPYVSTNPGLGFLNCYAVGGARVIKQRAYYIASDPQTGRNVYHRAECKELAGADENVWRRPYDSAKDCAKAGAFPCGECKP